MDKSFEGFFSTADSAAYVAESFAFAVSNSALTVEGLRSSLNYVGAEANAAGLNSAEVTALLAELADNGFTGSRAGTQLRRVFTELTKDGKDVSKEFFDLIRNGRTFAEALDEVGVRAAGTFTALTGSSEAIKAFAEQIRSSQGVLGYFADTLDQSLFASQKKVESAFGELSIVLTDTFKPALMVINSIVASFLKGLAKLPAFLQVIVIGFGSLLAILPPLIFLLGALSKAVGTLTLQFPAFGAALAAVFTSPWLIAATVGLTAIVALIGALSGNSKEASKSVEDLRNEINDLAKQGRGEDAIKLAIDREQELLAVRGSLEKENERLIANVSSYESALSNLEKQLGDVAKAEGRTGSVGSRLQGTERSVPLFNQQEEESIRNARTLSQEANAQLKLNRESLESTEAQIKALRVYLSTNEAIVDRLVEQKAAQEDVGVTVNDLLKQYKDLTIQVENYQKAFKDGGGTKSELNDTIGKIADLQAELKRLEDIFSALGVSLPGGEKDKETILGTKYLEKLSAEYIKLQTQLTTLTSGSTFNLDKITKVKDELSDLEAIFSLIGVDVKLIEGTLQNFEFINDQEKAKANALSDAISQLKFDYDQLFRSGLDSEFAALRQQWNLWAKDIELSEDQVILLNNALNRFINAKQEAFDTDQAREYSDAIKDWGFGMAEVFSGVGNSLADIALGVRSFGEVFEDIMKKVLARIITVTIAWLVLNAVSGMGGNLGAAAAAFTQANSFGSLLLGNSLANFSGANAPIAPRSFAGVVSGSNLIIAESRGVTAYDRIYG